LALGSEHRLYLQFSYLKCLLSGLNSADYWESNNLVARLNLPSMRHEKGHKVAVYAQAIKGLLALAPDPAKQAKYLDFVDIYSALDDNEMQLYIDQYPQESLTMATLSERLRAEGMEKGMQQGMQHGIQQGMQQGEITLLSRLLTRRFGPLDAEIVKRLEAASTEDLELFAENLMDAQSLEEVFTRH